MCVDEAIEWVLMGIVLAYAAAHGALSYTRTQYSFEGSCTALVVEWTLLETKDRRVLDGPAAADVETWKLLLFIKNTLPMSTCSCFMEDSHQKCFP